MYKTARARRLLSCVTAALLVLAALLPVSPVQGAQASSALFSDTSRHWARSYIASAVAYGFVNGYEDGTFRPDNNITRAEFTRMLNLALGNEGLTYVEFHDVYPNDWYYSDVIKGVAAGFTGGRSSTEFAPNDDITRQEAVVMLGRIVPSAGTTATLKVFGDFDQVGDWAAQSMQKIVAKGYVNGYSDGNLHPRDMLTRAQAAKIITDVLDHETIVRQNQTIVATGVTLEDTIYSNRISVGTDVGDGIATFSNCTVLGTMNIEGGGILDDYGVIIQNTRVARAFVHRADNPVRVYVKGETSVLNADVEEIAKMETGALNTSGEFGRGFRNINVNRAGDVTLKGDFENVNIEGSKVDIDLIQGSIYHLNVLQDALRAAVTVGGTGTVETADVYADGAEFKGTGIVRRLNAYGNSIVYEADPYKVFVDDSVTVPPARASGADKRLIITSDPVSGSVRIPLNPKIDVNFSSAVRLEGMSSDLTSSHARSVISLRRGSPTGSLEECVYTVSGDYRKVTMEPVYPLKTDTTYYIVVKKNALEDIYGNKNEEFTASFSTGTADADISFYPSNGSEGAALNTRPTITFSNPVYRYGSGSSAFTDTYIASCVNLQRVNVDGSKTDLSFKASIDYSNKVITIEPELEFEEETSYTVTLNEKMLIDSNGEEIERHSASFKTSATSLIVGEASSSDMTAWLRFTALKPGVVYGIIFPVDELGRREPSAENIRYANYVSSAAEDGHFAITEISNMNTAGVLNFYNLRPATDYYIYLVLYDSNGAQNAFRATVSTLTSTPHLTGLQIIRTYTDGSTSRDYPTDIDLNSSDQQIYYVASGAATRLKVQPKTDIESPVYTVTCSVPGSQVSTSSNPSYVDIPADSTTGNLVVTVTSSGGSYNTKSYTVNIGRITPEIDSVSFTGTLGAGNAVILYDNFASDLSLQNVTVPSGMSNLTLDVGLAEKRNSDRIRFEVRKYVEETSSWSYVTGGDGTNFAVNLGDITAGRTVDYYDGIYSVTATANIVEGTDSFDESVTRYFAVGFTQQ